MQWITPRPAPLHRARWAARQDLRALLAGPSRANDPPGGPGSDAMQEGTVVVTTEPGTDYDKFVAMAQEKLPDIKIDGQGMLSQAVPSQVSA